MHDISNIADLYVAATGRDLHHLYGVSNLDKRLDVKGIVQPTILNWSVSEFLTNTKELKVISVQ